MATETPPTGTAAPPVAIPCKTVRRMPGRTRRASSRVPALPIRRTVVRENELNAITVCRGYVSAQKEYASEVHDDSGVNQYAQKIFSTPGKQDGLFWKNADGTPDGPIGDAVAKALEEGYTAGEGGFHGYYFKILKGQGRPPPMAPSITLSRAS